MSHIPFEEWLAVYDDLGPGERERVEEHLRGCPECAVRLAEYRAIQRALSAGPAPAPDGRLREGFYAAVARAGQEPQRESRRRPLWRATLALGSAAAWVGVAAVVALLALSLAVTWPHLARQAWPAATAAPTVMAGVAAELAGEWVLTALEGAPLLEGTQITLNLEVGKGSGFAGCNRYAVEYRVTGEGGLSIELGSMTAQGCVEPEGVLAQEEAYAEALRSVTSYRLAGDRLELGNAAGDTVLTYRRRVSLDMDPAALVGTAWQLISWDGRPPLEGSTITIAFAEGEISGQAGCRGYTGTYEASGDHIRIPRLGMTETEPQCSQALLQQEGEYTTCLGWASHYRLGEGQLELLTERGETLVYEPVSPAGWHTHVDYVYGVSLQRPAHWLAVEGYDLRYGGADGYFDLSARSGALSIDEVAASEAGHKLQPYGSSPTVEALTVRGQEARLILPSADQNEAMEQRAVLIVRYPQPVTIRGETYEYLLLGADRGHIRELAATLEFIGGGDVGPVEGWTGTLVKNCSMAQFDDYFQREDGLRCGIAGATEAVEAEIERLRCQPATRVQVWGHIVAETMDAYGQRIVVERLEVVMAPPSPTPWPGPSEEPVEGWEGYAIPCSEGDAGRFFLLADGTRLAIEAGQAEALEELRMAKCEGYPVRIWGTLYREGEGVRILAERVERLGPDRASAPSPLPVEPVVAGGEMDVDSWSPDGVWLAFWRAEEDATPSAMGPLMTLNFYHMPTGEVCSYPETEMTVGARWGLSTGWTGDGRFAIWGGEEGKLVAPCRGSFQPVGEAVPPPAARGVAQSPGGSYRVSTVYAWGDEVPVEVVSTFTEVATGRTVQVVEYDHGGGDTPVLPWGPGGEWVTDGLFLINYTRDRGPLLVDLEQGRVLEVGPELFGIRWDPLGEGYSANVHATSGGRYHLALSGPRVRLYHSETGQVEVLDLPYTLWPAFSPDGEWLLMVAHPYRPAPGTQTGIVMTDVLWARRVDPPGSPAQFVAEGDPLWPPYSPDGSRLAMASLSYDAGQPQSLWIYSFPEGGLLGSWDTGEYHVYQGGWTEDGKRLAAVGSIHGTGKGGLFVVEP